MALSLGTNFTLVVTEHGDLYAFGTNHNGQLGLGTTENQLLPALVDKVQAFAGQQAVADFQWCPVRVARYGCCQKHTSRRAR